MRRRRPAAPPLALALALTATGCASDRARCGLAACGVDDLALLEVTSAQLSAPPRTIELYDVHHFPEATVAWRASHAGREFQCREARDPADPKTVRFVYCRPAT